MSRRSIQDTPIAIVGAGNLAFNLAMALYKNGYRIVQVYSRTKESARSLADKVEAEWTTNIQAITTEASLYIVALKDSVLVDLIPQLLENRRKALWVHTAGSISMTVWEEHALRYGVFYPMQTFSKQHEVNFKELSLFIEAADPADAGILKAVGLSLTPKVYEADSVKRKKLHLAAVFACNFANHMYTLANDILEEAGIPFDAMLPLIDETARKVHKLMPQEAQTGPAVRYDTNVLDEHLSLLDDKPGAQELYRLISLSIHNHPAKPGE